MSAKYRAQLEPDLKHVELPLRQVLLSPNAPIKYVYFLENGLASVVATTPDERRLEVGIFGREGMGSTAILLGDDQSPHEHFIQIAGSGHRIPADALLSAIGQSPTLNKLLLRYFRAYELQIAQTALANGSFNLNERLARWLLMCHDRVDGDDLPITHEFLGIMLGVRRAGVTVALQTFEGDGTIRMRRGCVVIRNRAKLEEMAGGSYGPAEAAYERLIGSFRDTVLERS